MSINVAIVGLGYWGAKLLRNFASNSDCVVKYAIDKDEDLLSKHAHSYPRVQFEVSLEPILTDEDVDAVVIATPVFLHYPLAKQALNAGKHILIEKPMTSSVNEAQELMDIAKEKGVTLMVDHTFLYTGAVMKIKEIVDSGELGNLRYFDSSRINLGLFQADINVLWDLATHDISILKFLFPDNPHSVQATGVSHTENGIENIAYLTLNYESGMIAHFNCSWTSPVKVRQTLIGGDEKMIVYNDMEPTNKVQVYDYGYKLTTAEEKNKIIADYRMGDIFVPKIDLTEALAMVVEDFLSSIMNKTEPKSSAQLGLEVVKVLEASNESLKNKGIEVLIK